MSVDTASRIIPVERRNIFVFLTVLFCMVNVAPGTVGTYISIGVLVLYAIFFVLVAVHAGNRERIPRFLAGSADDTLSRLRETPWDVLTMIGCIGLTVAKWFFEKSDSMSGVTGQALRQLMSIILVAFAFWLSNRNRKPAVTPRRRGEQSQTGAKSIFMKLMGKGPKPVPRPTPEESNDDMPPGALDTVVYEGGGDGSVPPVTGEESERAQKMAIWEERQRERWDDWIRQELLRLNEDREDG